MFGTKKTKQNVFRTKALSINLASTDMLNLVDYFGSKQKDKIEVDYTYQKSEFVYAPVLDVSRWVYECEVAMTVNTGKSDTFFCRIKNVQFDPVIYSGQYHSLGKHLGKIGDFLRE